MHLTDASIGATRVLLSGRPRRDRDPLSRPRRPARAPRPLVRRDELHAPRAASQALLRCGGRRRAAALRPSRGRRAPRERRRRLSSRYRSPRAHGSSATQRAAPRAQRGRLGAGPAGVPRGRAPLPALARGAAGRGLPRVRREGRPARQARPAIHLLEHRRFPAARGVRPALRLDSSSSPSAAGWPGASSSTSRGARRSISPSTILRASNGSRAAPSSMSTSWPARTRPTSCGATPRSPGARPCRPLEPRGAPVALGLRDRGRRARRRPRPPIARPPARRGPPRYRLHGCLPGLDLGPLALPRLRRGSRASSRPRASGLVTIVDPGIKADDGYSVYEEAREGPPRAAASRRHPHGRGLGPDPAVFLRISRATRRSAGGAICRSPSSTRASPASGTT